MGSRVIRIAALVLFAGTLALILLAGCRTSKRTSSTITLKETGSTFVGDAVCGECHSAEFEEHQGSGHAKSLRWANRKDLGEDAPQPGRIPGTQFAVQERDGKLYFVSTAGKNITQRLDIAFGAGDTGITFCTINGPQDFTKLRISYFPREKRWRSTPGMRVSDFEAGRSVTGSAIVGCVKCHAVTLPENSAVPDDRFLGIGCESCHGPGSAHVEAAKKPGSTNLHIADLGKKSPLEIQTICSSCHSPINDSMMSGAEGLLRFQPESLLASRCFAESKGKLSCITCHDSHRDVERNPRAYEPVCISCHRSSEVKVSNPRMTAAVCPVNPKSGCLPCHMPKRESFHESEIPTMMTDHRIAVHP